MSEQSFFEEEIGVDDMSSYGSSNFHLESQSVQSDYASSSETDISEKYLSSKCNSHLSHRKHKLPDTQFSDSDLSSHPSIKHRLRRKSVQNHSPFSSTSSTVSSNISRTSPQLRLGNNISTYVLLKSANDCEKNIRQLLRTAYQFTRHSNREKLTLKDLEKAFKIHKVDMKSVDCESLVEKLGAESPEAEDKSQPFDCSGKWLKKPENTKNNE